MSTILKVKNYKRIKDEIQLMNFDQVNYLVGKNNSGKSSILNAISHLNDGSNARRFFSEHSKVELLIDDVSRSIKWESREVNPNHTSNEGGLSIKIITPGIDQSEFGLNNVTSNKFNYTSIARETLGFINETAAIIGVEEINAERVIDNTDPWSTEVGTRVFKQDESSVLIEHLSSGLKSYNDLRYSIIKSIGSRGIQSTNDPIFILIEEPETSLHPELQKKIPKFIEEVKESLRTRSMVFFLISTHSPFVISAASKYENHKVYLFEDGKLLDLAHTPQMESEGYGGNECSWIVGQMLGSEVTDLGYPENYIILEEYSMQLILDDARKKSIIRNFQFVSASGASRLAKLSETINELGNLNTLIKCNPYYFDKYLIIIDNYSDFTGKEKVKLDGIKAKLNERFIQMKLASLEAYYHNIDVELFKDYTVEAEGKNSLEKGLLKEKYAVLIADRIESKEDFSKLFDGELDLLLESTEDSDTPDKIPSPVPIDMP